MGLHSLKKIQGRYKIGGKISSIETMTNLFNRTVPDLNDRVSTMTPTNKNRLTFSEGAYLTDGGLETTLIFEEGIDLPFFASFNLLAHAEGRQTLTSYYNRYLDIARNFNLNFILETPTWRANHDWGQKLGFDEAGLDRINRESVAFMRELKTAAAHGINHIAISGNIGPRGDGYVPESIMSSSEARAYHQRQVRVLAEERVDLVTALTINYSDEGIGIVQAAREENVPAVISFTVETNGRLPGGESLEEAIEKTDEHTDGYASYYMINCAHPTHFDGELVRNGIWKTRIKGIRANASTKSHAELDESTSLDSGDRDLLARGYVGLKSRLPELKVIGGCCGTDHRHVDSICQALFGG